MKHLFLILIILKFVFTNVYAEVINDVQIKNNKRITKETIITFGGIKLGNDYSDEQLNKILIYSFFIDSLNNAHPSPPNARSGIDQLR